MIADFAGAGQIASLAADALAWEGVEILTIIASSLHLRDKELKSDLGLMLLYQIARAFGQIATYVTIEWFSGGHNCMRDLEPGEKILDHSLLGIVNINVLPLPTSLSTQIRPSWASIIPLAMARPRPMRPDSLVKELPLPV